MSKIYRQGDVNLFLVSEDIDFANAEEIKPREGRVILALGEVTGHFHSVEATKAKQFRLNDKEYIKVTKPTEITHQEHSPFVLPKGVYEKRIAREYLEPGKVRKVVD